MSKLYRTSTPTTTVSFAPQPRPAQQQSVTQRLIAEARQRKEDAAELAALFASVLPYFDTPDTRQWNIWLRRYEKSVIAESIEATAAQYENASEMFDKNVREGKLSADAQLKLGTLDGILRYATGVMVRKTKERYG